MSLVFVLWFLPVRLEPGDGLRQRQDLNDLTGLQVLDFDPPFLVGKPPAADHKGGILTCLFTFSLHLYPLSLYKMNSWRAKDG